LLRSLLKRLLGLTALPFVALAAPFYAVAARTGIGLGICRRLGFHPLRVHFYTPVPAYEEVPARHFLERHACPGIDLNTDLAPLARFAGECDWPEQPAGAGRYYSQNGMFGYSSAVLLHCVLRSYASRRVIEVGGGYSSLISMAALRLNGPGGTFTCVEPYPSAWLAQAIASSGGKLVREPVQTLGPELFGELQAGDLLFIDSSHVSKLASDVNHLYLSVLPTLRPGVLVHVHDIYIPYEYPREHFFSSNQQFWNEQYLLQALLSANPALEVLVPAYYLQSDRVPEFKAAFPGWDPQRHRRSSSFYFRKRA